YNMGVMFELICKEFMRVLSSACLSKMNVLALFSSLGWTCVCVCVCACVCLCMCFSVCLYTVSVYVCVFICVFMSVPASLSLPVYVCVTAGSCSEEGHLHCQPTSSQLISS